MDLSSCSKGEYDVVFLTASRYEKYAGNTVFPDGSGNIIRTTSKFANDNVNYDPISGWGEASKTYSDDALGYVIESGVYNKTASTPSSDDLSSASDTIANYDWAKSMISGGNTTALVGWYCDGNADTGLDSLCERAIDNDKLQSRIRKTETLVVEGLPLTIGNGDTTLDFDINYNSTSSRGDNDELGLKVLWHNDGGTLKYLGIKPGESEMYISIGEPRPLGI
jgi:hypothetical protein